MLPYVSTEDTARDMDVIRAALGDEKLSYLGASYGTYLGAVYAGLFPDRVGRLVLDGALDPSLDGIETGKGQLVGFQQAFDSFVADCAKHDDCPLPADAAAAGRRIADFYLELDESPIPTFDPARPLTEGLANLGIGEALYAPEYFWEPLRTGLAQAFGGDGSTLLQLADLYTDRKDDGSFGNLLEANIAINCLDKGSLSTLEEAAALVPDYEKLSPVFGAGFAWGTITCREWPYPPVAEVAPIAAEGAAPILVVGTTRDPATPYVWAEALADQLASGVLLTYDGDGHTAYNRGNACINRAVEAYLVAGNRPQGRHHLRRSGRKVTLSPLQFGISGDSSAASGQLGCAERHAEALAPDAHAGELRRGRRRPAGRSSGFPGCPSGHRGRRTRRRRRRTTRPVPR